MPTARSSPASNSRSVTSPLIELRGVSRAFEEGGRRRLVLDRVDATIERGEIVVLLGRSGSGKSTLLHLLDALDRPDAGSVRVDGVALETLDEHGRALFRREKTGFVFQFFNLVPTLSVLENVLLPLELAGQRDGEARAHALLSRVGLEDRADAFPDRLSGGEQQRVAIARALVGEAPLLLADEPTGNLDLETGRIVLRLLDELVRESGCTLVMATHSREVVGIADRILHIDHGKLVEETGEQSG